MPFNRHYSDSIRGTKSRNSEAVLRALHRCIVLCEIPTTLWKCHNTSFTACAQKDVYCYRSRALALKKMHLGTYLLQKALSLNCSPFREPPAKRSTGTALERISAQEQRACIESKYGHLQKADRSSLVCSIYLSNCSAGYRSNYLIHTCSVYGK